VNLQLTIQITQVDLPSEFKDFQVSEISREDQIEDQIDKMFAEYYENDDITKEFGDTVEKIIDST
jgi:hypothetical protein